MHRCVMVVLLFCVSIVAATERDVVTRSMVREGWLTYRFHIKWGIRTRTKQVWDGHVTVEPGKILKVDPFIRHEIPVDNMLVSETSWKSTTYTDVEGVYLTVYAPQDSTVRVFTATNDFAFNINDLEVGQTQSELDGDIEITNVTEELLFRIAGLETGRAGKGSATVSPAEAVVGTLGTWTVTYTAPDGGVPVGGGIRLSWHFTRTWGEPQFDRPNEKNYVTVRTTGAAALDYKSEHRGLFEYPFTRGRILVRVLEEPVRKGDQIIVTLGDRIAGGPGFEAPVIVEENTVIRVEDCTAIVPGSFPVYRRLKELPSIAVLPAASADRLFVVAPSVVQAGEPFDVRIVVEDVYRNVATSFEGPLQILIDDKPLRDIAVSRKDKGMLTVRDLQLSKPGPYWIDARGTTGILKGRSNPILCVAEPRTEQLVWGELHGHTQYSDGYGSADDYFQFARRRALLEFAAITDHDVELDAPDYHVAEMWDEVNAAVSRHNDPPQFSTILAYEWSPARETISTIEPYGDHNVYYKHEHMPIFTAGDPIANTLPKLYRNLLALEHGAVQVIPHVGGAIGNWDFHHPVLENLGEIFSVHGSFEAFGQIALDKGYIIGFVGAADSHNGQIGGFGPGNATGHFSHGGLTAAFVSERSRTGLLEALKERRVYATSGSRIYLDFKINKQPMGRVIKCDTTPTIEVDVIGAAPLLSVEVIKNGRVLHTWENRYRDDENLTLLWGNRVQREDLLNFDESLWSSHLRHADWEGELRCQDGRLVLQRWCSFDYPKDGLRERTDQRIAWSSQTRGDWDGVSVSVCDAHGPLDLHVGEYDQTIDPDNMSRGMTRTQLGESDWLLVVNGSPIEQRAEFMMPDRTILRRRNHYYIRVLQIDGEMAWSSPIFIDRAPD